MIDKVTIGVDGNIISNRKNNAVYLDMTYILFQYVQMMKFNIMFQTFSMSGWHYFDQSAQLTNISLFSTFTNISDTLNIHTYNL